MTLEDFAMWFAMTSKLTCEVTSLNEYDEVESITITADDTAREVLP